MNSQRNHYETVLAQHYTWMFGVPFEQKVTEQAELLCRAQVRQPGVAVDLGCGSGFQSIALANLGAARVHAFDTSATLLAELGQHAGDKLIKTYHADLLTFATLVAEPADTIVCMGDTLTHLESRNDVADLFRSVASKLRKGGRFVLSWRDLSKPPQGLKRFIPLRSTDDCLMVCFLEDQGETILVHDLVHVRKLDGWQFQSSAYPKLKLTLGFVREQLCTAGLQPDFEHTIGGMTILAASSPTPGSS
jgi:predicted TPR repeat methyltransferase